MKKANVASSPSSKRKIRPAINPEAEENQMISLAIDLAKQQLLDGTASSQVITHFLKLGTAKAQLEKEKLEKENKLLAAKTDAIEQSSANNDMYEKAVAAMKNYTGNGDYDEY